MRLSLIKLAKAAIKEGAPMAILSRPSTTALAKKYNYGLRIETYLDDIHGYAWWVIKNKFGEMWPLLGCLAFYGFLVSYIGWWTCQKTTVQVNRFTEHRPWDWERAQYAFGKRKKAFFNDADMWPRIPELDKLQAEMLEVKNQRLAAAKAAQKGH